MFGKGVAFCRPSPITSGWPVHSQWTAPELRETVGKATEQPFLTNRPLPSATKAIESTKSHFTFTRLGEACTIRASVLPHKYSSRTRVGAPRIDQRGIVTVTADKV
jgi:hypothetical protein